jgi:hypothetical protein
LVGDDGAANSAGAWLVVFNGGGVGTDGKASTDHAWCVRGGMNAEAY